MTVRPELVLHRPRKDRKCLIRLYTYHEGKQKYINTGMHVLPTDWDKEGRVVKKTDPLYRALNAKIASQVFKYEQKLLGINGSLLEFIEDYIEECKKGMVVARKSTVQEYRKHLNRLKSYCRETEREDIYFMDVDLELYKDFKRHLADHGNISASIDNHIKWLKKFMRESKNRGLHQNDIASKREFKRLRSEKKDKIYLTEDEVNQLVNVSLEHLSSGYAKERDRWLVAYYLLIRFTDTCRIREDLFFMSRGKRYYRNNALKTSQTKYVPVGSICWEILCRNEFKFDGANPVANRYIKEIGKLAGINTEINGVPKWSLITTHTARRSMATHLHQSGMDVKTIMQLGGWKSEKAFKAYLLSSDLQLATQAAESRFFQ